MIRRPPRPPLFPYPTLSRSGRAVPVFELRVGHDDLAAIDRRGLEFFSARIVLGFEEQPRTRAGPAARDVKFVGRDRKSTRLNSSHLVISYAVFCLKKKTINN